LSPVNKMTIEFSSLPVNVAFARVAAGAFASQLDFTLNDLEELRVAVSEAVTNAIVHGYAGSSDRTVRLQALIEGESLTIVVEDQGIGIEDIEKALEPAYSTDPERMGLGFSFIQSFSDTFHLDSTPGRGTRVTMTRVRTREANPGPNH